MKTLVTALTVVVFATLALEGTAANAADNHYAAFTISNPTNATLTYSVRWGNGQACNYHVAAGCYLTHHWRYAYCNQNNSPTPRVTFDYIGGDGCYTPRDYCVTAYAVPSPNYHCSKRYKFQGSHCGRYLELVHGH